MNCIEFKRLALSEPNSADHDFVSHSKSCPDCLKYVGGIRKMDADLSDSLNIEMPSDMVARLQLNQEMLEEMQDEPQVSKNVFAFQPMRKHAMVACVAVSLFVAGFVVSSQLNSNAIGDDYELLLSRVVEHMDHQAVTPLWDAERANETANALLASYDGNMRLKFLDSLQFARICPMGEKRGFHSALDTNAGQVTFVYIKGDSVGEPIDATYEGYASRVKPIRGGNLIIISHTNKGMQEADSQLNDAIYWDI